MIHVVTFVCRGATAALRTGRFGEDDPLDERAAREAEALANLLPASDRAWTGPDRASRRSAEALRLDAVVDPALRDLDYGAWTGRTIKEIRSEAPDLLAAWVVSPATATPPGGEPIGQLVARVGRWLAGRRNGGASIVVAAAAVVRAAVVHALDAGEASFPRLDVRPLSRTELTSDGRRWNVRAFGRLD
ncbi:MAG: histidine phosphatase family protein [Methylorubrum populi]